MVDSHELLVLHLHLQQLCFHGLEDVLEAGVGLAVLEIPVQLLAEVVVGTLQNIDPPFELLYCFVQASYLSRCSLVVGSGLTQHTYFILKG